MKVFPSWLAFTSWKEEEEQRTYSFFAQQKGAVESTNDNGTYMWLNMCNCMYLNVNYFQ